MARGFVRALTDAGRFPLASQRILDIGCAWGNWLVELEIWGADQARLAGIDLEPRRAAIAAARLRDADVQSGNATSLPWPPASFDVILLGTVLSSVLDPQARSAIAAEVRRVLSAGGIVLWYDFFRDNPRNPNVQGIKANEISRLFPDLAISLRRATLAPPIARRLAPWSWTACHVLESTKVLNTHYLGVLANRGQPDPGARSS
jgi:ubiquinone/menaquinone biosynthesis C-methylase UbiE